MSLLWLVPMLILEAHGGNTNSLKDIPCTDIHLITREMIKLELYGTRWTEGRSVCLKQDDFKVVKASRNHTPDDALHTPEFLLKDEKSVKVISETALKLGGVKVHFSYVARKNGKEQFVKDDFSYVLNSGPTAKKQGCASYLEEPSHFVMLEKCLKTK